MFRAFKLTTLSRTIIGPVVGGYLAEPVRQYPFLFDAHSVWERFPYLLPNLLVVILLLMNCILGFLCLEEVHSRFRHHTDIGRTMLAGISNLMKGRGWSDSKGRYTYIHVEDSSELRTTADSANQLLGSGPLRLNSPFTKQVMLQILSSTILGFLKIATLAIVPIFLAAPYQPSTSATSSKAGLLKSVFGVKGGYGLDPQSISNVLLTQAVAATISQLAIVPIVIARLGSLTTYRLALVMLMLLFCIMPLSAGLPHWLGLLNILVILWVYALVNGLCTTCEAIL